MTILLVDQKISLAQKTLKNFEGDIIFKESSYYYPLSRKIYDTVITYSLYEVYKMINIIQFADFSDAGNQENDYLPIKFCTIKNYIFYKYSNKFNIKHDTTFIKLFPLSLNDTIKAAYCFKITMDTIRETDKSHIYTECYGDDTKMETYRTKDTIIYFKDFKFDCYSFEQTSTIGHYHDVLFTRKILIDKLTLIPIDLKEYKFYTSNRPADRNITQGKNLLTYHQKLISID